MLWFAVLGLAFPAQGDMLAAGHDRVPTAFQRGVAAYQSGHYDEAREQFSQAIQQQPSSAAYGNRCLVHVQRADYAAAIADCTQSLKLDPNNTEAYLNRGLAAYRSGNFEGAIADYTTLLQITPLNPRAYYNRGLARIGQRAYREALVDYGEALRQTSPLDRAKIAVIHNDRGIAYLLLSQQQEAIADFTQAIQFNATDVRAFFNRGCAYHQQGNALAALDDFSQVVELDPDYAQAYLNRGLIQRELGQLDRAIANLQAAAGLFERQQSTSAYHQTWQLMQQLQTRRTAIG